MKTPSVGSVPQYAAVVGLGKIALMISGARSLNWRTKEVLDWIKFNYRSGMARSRLPSVILGSNKI